MAATPSGPAYFSRKFKAPIIPIFIVRKEGYYGHQAIVKDPIYYEDTGDRQLDDYRVTLKMTRIVEEVIRNILITGYGSSIAGIRHTHLQERSRSMLRNKGFQMIVGAIVITGVIIAWLMLGGEAPSNNPVQKESSGANAKVRNSTLAREVDGKKVWEFTVEEVEQIKSSGEAVLKGVKGKIYREDGSVLEVVAGGGKVKMRQRILN